MKERVETFKALSDENRLKILQMLSDGELCACDIQENLNLAQPTISHHMKVLSQAGLIHTEKRGKWAYYSLNQKNVEALQGFITDITTPTKTNDYHVSNCDCDGTRKVK